MKALCYVPIEDVHTVWSTVLEDASVLDDEDEETEDMANLLSHAMQSYKIYFEGTWIRTKKGKEKSKSNIQP